MGAAPEGVGGGPPPTPRACAPRGAGSRVDAEAFRSHMETWMERVEVKVDGLTEVLGRRRVLLDGADSCVEGPSPILSLQRSFERQISSPFQKQQSAGTEISSPLQKQQSAGTEISSPFQTEQSAVADKEEAEPGGKRHGIVDSETEDGAISHRTTTSESPAAGDISMPTMEVGARSTSRESRERELTKRLELELRVSRQGPLGRFVQSQRFDSMVIALIVLNAAVLGVDVQLRAFSNTNLEWISYVELICTSAFTVELFLRVSVHRVNFFTDSRERIWNIYDFFLIAASWVDFFIQSIMSDSSAFLVKAGRVIRMFRIVRVVRTVRFLSQLRVMLQMIPILWARCSRSSGWGSSCSLCCTVCPSS
ncbi:unnamed protein product [Prorocentrum cordatum]|uniref:Ion transport domain-containing protein n=1 Tax=Prorocentrum cordatum TaxID=2364126 RepID=A0ABN9VTR5_9DINO|nr:unnamed protein product [Polarella glacialis]